LVELVCTVGVPVIGISTDISLVRASVPRLLVSILLGFICPTDKPSGKPDTVKSPFVIASIKLAVSSVVSIPPRVRTSFAFETAVPTFRPESPVASKLAQGTYKVLSITLVLSLS
jgi:hypothetical protein